MFKLFGAACACALIATAAAAAPMSAAKTPPSEGAKSEAARLIADAKAQAYFEDASEGEGPGVRHLRSGLKCTFEPGSADNRIILFPGRIAAGDDVGCVTSASQMVMTLYATRYPPPAPSAQEVLNMARAAIRMRYPGAKPFEGQSLSAEVEPAGPKISLPEHLRARMTFDDGGKTMFTKTDVARVGDWIIKQRTTSADQMGADLMSELQFAAILSVLSEEKATEQ